MILRMICSMAVDMSRRSFRWEYRFESALLTLLNTKCICQEKPDDKDWQGNRYYLTDIGRGSVRG